MNPTAPDPDGAAAGAPGFFTRWGLALAAPRAAARLADDPEVAGRAAGDLLRAIAVVLVVAHTRELVAAGWIAFEVGVGMAVPPLLRALSGAAMFGLVFVVVASPVISLLAGRRRSLGRDFDLGCVAALGPVTVAMIATLAARTLGDLDAVARALVLAAAVAWGGWIAAVAVMTARRRA